MAMGEEYLLFFRMGENRVISLSDLVTLLGCMFVCIVAVGEAIDKKIKLNGSPAAKPKATRVRFADEVQKNDGSVQSKTPTLADHEEDVVEEEESCDSESDSGSEGSQTEQFGDEQENTTTVDDNDDNLVLTPDMADLMLSYLDLMNLRTLLSECTAASLLKKHMAGGQARLDEAMRMLDEIPATMSDTERKEYMLDICKYVQSVFASLEKLSVKLVKCHGATVCEIIQEFDDNVKKIESEVQKPKRTVRRVRKKDTEKAMRVLEVGVLFAFVVLTAYVVFVLTRPEIGSAFGEFVLGVMNDTWNITDKSRLPIANESSSLAAGVFENLVVEK